MSPTLLARLRIVERHLVEDHRTTNATYPEYATPFRRSWYYDALTLVRRGWYI